MKYLTISATGLNRIQMCPRKYYYEDILRLAPLHKAEALEKGDLMHQILECYYGDIITNIKSESSYTPLQMIDRGIEVGRRASVDMDIPPQVSMEVEKQFRDYVLHYTNEPWEPLGVEQKFSKVLYSREDDGDYEGLTILSEGKIDLIARHRQMNKVFVWDHKTGARRDTPSGLSNQFFNYAWATGHNNVIINKIGFQKTLKPAERFQRFIKSYPQACIDEWVNDQIFWCNQIDMFVKAGHFPTNFTSCDKYGGCIFAEACEAHPEARIQHLKAKFMVRKFDLFQAEQEAAE